ncbi:MAG: hypothetical protein ACTSRI_15810 [Promethearchaeota archaeon]
MGKLINTLKKEIHVFNINVKFPLLKELADAGELEESHEGRYTLEKRNKRPPTTI